MENKEESISYYKLKSIIEDFFYKEDSKIFKDLSVLKELPENFNLDDKIKDGFLYQISNGKTTVLTGAGGVRDVIKKNREEGTPDFVFVDMISVTNDDALCSNTVFYPIRSVIWNK